VLGADAQAGFDRVLEQQRAEAAAWHDLGAATALVQA
jgi:hypothetical protein